MFIENNTTKYIVKGDIAIICTGDDQNYYLAKLIINIYETKEYEKDDNNHEIPAQQKVIACSYLEVHKDIKEGTIYCTEQKKNAMTSTYCVARVFQTLKIYQEKCRGSTQDIMYIMKKYVELLVPENSFKTFRKKKHFQVYYFYVNI